MRTAALVSIAMLSAATIAWGQSGNSGDNNVLPPAPGITPGASPVAQPQAPAGPQKPVSISTDLYTVKDGNKVDPKTLEGWKTWRAMDCERCHGPNQEGLVGPALVNSLKVLTKDQFHTTITLGRVPKGMPNFGGVKLVQDNWQNLYAYLKGRSDGNILPGHLYPIPSK